MRRTPLPTTALVVASFVLFAGQAAAQSVQSLEASVQLGLRGPVANAPPPPRHESWAERYANRSASLLGGFGVQHMPYASQASASAFAMVTSSRFVVAGGLVLEPELSAYYTSVDPGGATSGGASSERGFGVRPGFRLGYARAVSDRVALIVEGGYRIDWRETFSGSLRTSADLSHDLLALVGATIFVSRHFFLEESIVAQAEFHREGFGFTGGVTSGVGVTF
jgi:hypothetical protein